MNRWLRSGAEDFIEIILGLFNLVLMRDCNSGLREWKNSRAPSRIATASALEQSEKNLVFGVRTK
jgi:hypothetical protein